MKGGFGCSPCCAPPGCADCGWTSNTFPVAGISRTNYCCEAECYPCEITLTVSAGNTWSGFSGFLNLLTTADRAAIRSYLSGTWVLRHSPSGSPYNPDYQFQDSSWLASLRIGTTLDTPCESFWPSYSGAPFVNNSRTIQNAISPVWTGSSLLSLSSSKYLQFARLNFAQSGGVSDLTPFTLGNWCGVSSWSYSFTSSASGFSNPAQSIIEFYTGTQTGTVALNGHTVTFSW